MAWQNRSRERYSGEYCCARPDLDSTANSGGQTQDKIPQFGQQTPMKRRGNRRNWPLYMFTWQVRSRARHRRSAWRVRRRAFRLKKCRLWKATGHHFYFALAVSSPTDLSSGNPPDAAYPLPSSTSRIDGFIRSEEDGGVFLTFS